MKEIHPLAELAPRDVVAYNIFKQINESDSGYIYLSLKHLDPDKIKARFSNIYQQLKKMGFDLTHELLPVAPAAHYMVGGIRTNLQAETNVKGLFACGEAASTGVMGANRLASNSLLECLVFGKRASEKAAKLSHPATNLPELKTLEISRQDENMFLEYQNEIAGIMSKNLGIVRTAKDIKLAKKRFTEIAGKFNNFNNEYNLLKIKNSATICYLIANAALKREESRGGHIRSDYPGENPEFRVHIVQQRNKETTFESIRE